MTTAGGVDRISNVPRCNVLADVEAQRIDGVVVYKVDRLSRSLLDFTRLLSLFEKHAVSFVSVTQDFNTSTSMGRLTLHILLSFAQFEREMISERTRDKLSAARRKGKWIGGIPVLGYQVAPEGGRLVVHAVEAERVRHIFAVCAGCSSLSEALQEARARGWTAKQWTSQRGKTHGGGPLIVWKAEIDMPFVGPWWYMRNIGGRITSSDGAHVELSPEEADDLHRHLQRVCDQTLKEWAKDHNLAGVIRDHTGVMIEPPHHSEGDNADIRRPATDAEFVASEARIARSVLEAAAEYRKPPFQDESVVEYEGFSNYPSFCQIAHRKHQGRVQFALIHMPHGGTSPTNMIESLATHFRQQFYPKIDPGLIDWFDVVPPNTYSSGAFGNYTWALPLIWCSSRCSLGRATGHGLIGKDSGEQEAEAGSSIHLPLNPFQAIDLTFDLAVTVGGLDSSEHCRKILLQPESEAHK